MGKGVGLRVVAKVLEVLAWSAARRLDEGAAVGLGEVTARFETEDEVASVDGTLEEEKLLEPEDEVEAGDVDVDAAAARGVVVVDEAVLVAVPSSFVIDVVEDVDDADVRSNVVLCRARLVLSVLPAKVALVVDASAAEATEAADAAEAAEATDAAEATEAAEADARAALMKGLLLSLKSGGPPPWRGRSLFAMLSLSLRTNVVCR